MMSERHLPLRRCVACREALPKAELLRFRRADDGSWRYDAGAKGGGRGAWLCRRCAERADSKRLQRFFKGQTAVIVAELAARSAATPSENHPGGMHG